MKFVVKVLSQHKLMKKQKCNLISRICIYAWQIIEDYEVSMTNSLEKLHGQDFDC